MRNQLLVVALAALILSSSAFAQSTFFSKGESGMGLAFGLLSSDEADGWQASIGGTAHGVLDFSAGFARVEETNIYALGAAYYLYKPRQLADPIAVSLGADVELTQITRRLWAWYGDQIISESQTLNAQLVNVGLDLHRTMMHSPSALIEFTAGMGMYKLFYEDANTEWEPSFSFAVPMVFGERDGTRFMLALGISAVRDGNQTESTFSGSIGILVGTGRNRSADGW